METAGGGLPEMVWEPDNHNESCTFSCPYHNQQEHSSTIQKNLKTAKSYKTKPPF